MTPHPESDPSFRRPLAECTHEVDGTPVEPVASTTADLAVDVAKNEFIANVRHELRTPLNSIIGFTSLLLESPLTLEQRRQLDYAHAAARQLLAKVDAIIDYADVAGFADLVDEEFTVASVLEQVRSAVADDAARKGIDLDVLDDTRRLRAFGDRERLRKAITELARNAVKFTDRGSVGIVATSAPCGLDVEEIRFVVADTGIGLAPELLETLSRPFSPVNSVVARRYGGLGLGLAIAKQTARLMGGDLTVESAPGKGSTFLFTVTIKRVD